eukprot:6465650-Amphidinium_carterae.1
MGKVGEVIRVPRPLFRISSQELRSPRLQLRLSVYRSYVMSQAQRFRSLCPQKGDAHSTVGWNMECKIFLQERSGGV